MLILRRAEVWRLRTASVLPIVALVSRRWLRCVWLIVARGLEGWDVPSAALSVIVVVIHHEVFLVLSEGLVEHVVVVAEVDEGMFNIFKQVVDPIEVEWAVFLQLV